MKSHPTLVSKLGYYSNVRTLISQFWNEIPIRKKKKKLYKERLYEDKDFRDRFYRIAVNEPFFLQIPRSILLLPWNFIFNGTRQGKFPKETFAGTSTRNDCNFNPSDN